MTSESSEYSSCSSTEELNLTVSNSRPDISDLSLIMEQCPYITNFPEFYPLLENTAALTNSEYTFGLIGIVDYQKAGKFIHKKMNKAISSINIGDTKDITLIFVERICNIPIHYLGDLYSTVSTVAESKYLILSPVQDVTKEMREYYGKELKSSTMKVREEEALLDNKTSSANQKKHPKCSIGDHRYQLYILSGKEYQEYQKRVSSIDKE